MKRAILNDANVLVGYGEPTGEPGEVLVPDDCDLIPGRYQWDGRAFMPVLPTAEQILNQPNTLRAVAKGFAAIRDSGVVTLPDETLDWLSAYENSFDARG